MRTHLWKISLVAAALVLAAGTAAAQSGEADGQPSIPSTPSEVTGTNPAGGAVIDRTRPANGNAPADAPAASDSSVPEAGAPSEGDAPAAPCYPFRP